jgi:Zn-dependent protease with chaperone function
MNPNSYRYPNEHWILSLTLLFLVVVGFVTAGATLCLAPLFVLVITAVAYSTNQTHHRNLLRSSLKVDRQHTPDLARLTEDCTIVLKPGQVNYFIYNSSKVNAYTFGFSNPKGVVLYRGLLETMDKDELKFVIGHELGHVALGHTRLHTLLDSLSAGMARSLGAAVLFSLIFRWWNRACEYSADRAGLLACGNPGKATSALIKLVAQDADTSAELERAYKIIEKEDDSLLNLLGETLSTHPMIINRIEKLQKYAASSHYQRSRTQISNL